MNNLEQEFIDKELTQLHYVELGLNISSGKVNKIHSLGSLEEDGYEVSYLFLHQGSSIKEHTHTNDVERYKCLNGLIKVNGEYIEQGICHLNESHNIDHVKAYTLVQTIKVNRKYYPNLEHITNDIFDDLEEMNLNHLEELNNSFNKYYMI